MLAHFRSKRGPGAFFAGTSRLSNQSTIHSRVLWEINVGTRLHRSQELREAVSITDERFSGRTTSGFWSSLGSVEDAELWQKRVLEAHMTQPPPKHLSDSQSRKDTRQGYIIACLISTRSVRGYSMPEGKNMVWENVVYI
jgi:hypothetical protein